MAIFAAGTIRRRRHYLMNIPLILNPTESIGTVVSRWTQRGYRLSNTLQGRIVASPITSVTRAALSRYAEFLRSTR